MLISHKYKFIFVHTYKVAGTSIRDALKPYCRVQQFGRGVQKVLAGRVPMVANALDSMGLGEIRHHATAREIRAHLSRSMFKRYFKFAFVRNPWDWQVSLYHYMLQSPDHFQHELVKGMAGFDEYIRWRVEKDKQLQLEFITGADGTLLVDFIGRIECLPEDFHTVCRNIGIGPIDLPHMNPSRHRDYQTYYTEETRELVRKHFREDIERFGYAFDGLKKVTVHGINTGVPS